MKPSLAHIKELTDKHNENKHYLYIPKDKKKNKTFPPTENKTSILSIAFNVAFENYGVLRKGIPADLTTHNCPYPLRRWFEFLTPNQEDFNLEFPKFIELERKIYQFITRLRNYHSHHIAEPGIINCTNYFETNTALSEGDISIVLDFFEDKFYAAQKHKTRTLESFNEGEDKHKAGYTIGKVVEKMVDLEFIHNGQIANDALLFIACMFLKTSQTEELVKKYLGKKNVEGWNTSYRKFFTYYSQPDSYSMNVDSPHLSEFRKIVSNLGTVARFDNERLSPLYDFIDRQNLELYEDLNPVSTRLNAARLKFGNLKTDRQRLDAQPNLERLNASYNNISHQLIPVRKVNNACYYYLRYLEENGQLSDFKIACRKSPTDIANEHNAMTIVELKDKIKSTPDGADKEVLKQVFRRQKRNFIFQPVGETQFRYTVQNNNVFLEYTFRNDEVISITVSQSILEKWVFVHLQDNTKAKQVKQHIIDFVTHYKTIVAQASEGDVEVKAAKALAEFNTGKYLDVKKVFSKSFHSTLSSSDADGQYNNMDLEALVNEKVAAKVEELDDFWSMSRRQLKPWKFESKRKIDIILRYGHFMYIKKARTENRSEDDIRHTAFNAVESNLAYQFLRFYGKEKGTKQFEEFFDQHKAYSGAISKLFGKARSLEDLFNEAIYEYLKALKMLKVNNQNKSLLASIFSISKPTSYAVTNEMMKKAYQQVVALPPDLINLSKFLPELSKDAIEERSQKGISKKTKGNKPINDFALIRQTLGKGINTASDFVLSKLMPSVIDGSDFEARKPYFNYYLKQKTSDLLCWEIAKYHFAKAGRVQEAVWDLDANSDDKFYQYCSFTRVFDQNCVLHLFGDTALPITISPRKMDDEFLNSIYFKSKNKPGLKVLWQKIQEEHTEVQFVELNKKVKKTLKQSIQDTALILTSEKVSLTHLESKKEEAIASKYGKEEELKEYYLEFNQVQQIIDEMTSSDETSKSYFSTFRNNAMHFQLQDETKAVKIRAALSDVVRKEYPDYGRNSSDGNEKKRYGNRNANRKRR